MLLFKLVEKKKFGLFLSLYLRFFFWTKKSSFQWNSPKMHQNNRKALFSCMRLILWRKTVFVNICPVLLLCTKRIVHNKSKFSFGFAPFRTCWEKKNFWLFQSFFLRFSFFWTKKSTFQWNCPKMYQNNRKACLVVCGSFCGEKQFLLIIFVPFYCFVQKGLFTTNPNLP